MELDDVNIRWEDCKQSFGWVDDGAISEIHKYAVHVLSLSSSAVHVKYINNVYLLYILNIRSPNITKRKSIFTYAIHQNKHLDWNR